MRGEDQSSGSLFSYVDLESRVPGDHPLRVIRGVVNEVLSGLSAEFEKLYSDTGRYAHARQIKRMRREVKRLKTDLGRVTRDVGRKIAGNEVLELRFARLLGLVERLLTRERHDKNKLNALHAPEVVCIAGHNLRLVLNHLRALFALILVTLLGAEKRTGSAYRPNLVQIRSENGFFRADSIDATRDAEEPVFRSDLYEETWYYA